jgi:hypothetical protein
MLGAQDLAVGSETNGWFYFEYDFQSTLSLEQAHAIQGNEIAFGGRLRQPFCVAISSGVSPACNKRIKYVMHSGCRKKSWSCSFVITVCRGRFFWPGPAPPRRRSLSASKMASDSNSVGLGLMVNTFGIKSPYFPILCIRILHQRSRP